MIGLIGYHIKQQEGYPDRFHYTNEWVEGELGTNRYVKTWLRQQSCIDKFGEYEFCLNQNTQRPPTVILIGDSHANHLYPGLLKYTAFAKDNLLNLSEGSCPPFFNIPREKCRERVNKMLTFALETSSIHTVILNSRDILNLKGLYDKPNLIEKVTNSLEKDLTSKRKVFFQQLMRTTFQKLVASKKRIIFVTDIPELDFNPTTCITRPWRISGKPAKNPCASLREPFENSHQVYRQLVSQVLAEFPEIEVWDTTPAFCDKKYCWAIKEQKMLYRDGNHLNETGSLYLADYLNKHYSLP